MSLDLSGVVPILPTPFTAEGDIDEEGFASTIDAAVGSGVHGVAMFGLASEFYKLSDAERFALIELVVRQVAKRCPVVISITPQATRQAVAEAIHAVEAGADALMVLPPSFAAPAPDALVSHIRAIAAAAPVPLLLQYAPLQTGRTFDTHVFARLAGEIPHLSCIKVDLVPSGPTISNLCAMGLQSMVGYMGLHLPEDFSRGVTGVMPTVSVSGSFVKLWTLLKEDSDRARELHRQMLPLLNFMMQAIEFLIACEKEILRRQGTIRSAFCREPACTLDPLQEAELSMHLSALEKWLG